MLLIQDQMFERKENVVKPKRQQVRASLNAGAQELKTVILAGRNLGSIPSPTEVVGETTLLDLSYNALTELAGIQDYQRVEELVLDNNRLSTLCLPPLPNLRALSINNNNLKDLDQLLRNIEKCAPQLIYLSLLRNPACPNELMSGDEDDYQNYRCTVINRLKNLKFLDSRVVSPLEREYSLNMKRTATKGSTQELLQYNDLTDCSDNILAATFSFLARPYLAWNGC